MISKITIEEKSKVGVSLKKMISLWKQFIPLSLSDVTMFFGDPIMNTTLAHLPDARLNLAAVGIAKSQAIFFESPIIMLLHASNALAISKKSREALWKFMVISIIALSGLLFILTIPPVFELIGFNFLGISKSLLEKSRVILLILVLWPAAIGWRRYYQGILIRHEHNKIVGMASIGRLVFTIAALILGYWMKLSGHILAGLTLVGGVIFEALVVTMAAKRLNLFFHYKLLGSAAENSKEEDIGRNDRSEVSQLPKNLREVWRFYWPLANSMLVVWGGRALLVGILARAVDSSIALAAWPVGWSLIILVANATRMVQQIIIRNKDQISKSFLLGFTLSVGLTFSLILFALGFSDYGIAIVDTFVGDDPIMKKNVLSAITMTGVLPILVALQNACQGFLISEGRTSRINIATWIGTIVLLSVTVFGVGQGWTGVKSASVAMIFALTVELSLLALGILPHRYKK
jgi:hypothetical protein